MLTLKTKKKRASSDQKLGAMLVLLYSIVQIKPLPQTSGWEQSQGPRSQLEGPASFTSTLACLHHPGKLWVTPPPDPSVPLLMGNRILGPAQQEGGADIRSHDSQSVKGAWGQSWFNICVSDIELGGKHDPPFQVLAGEWKERTKEAPCWGLGGIYQRLGTSPKLDPRSSAEMCLGTDVFSKMNTEQLLQERPIADRRKRKVSNTK